MSVPQQPADVQFESLPYSPCEIEHRYGDQVHILRDPLSLLLLAKLCAKGTAQPEVSRLIVELYRVLVHEVVAAEFPRERIDVPTRMVDVTPHGVWRGEVIAQRTPAVVVALARAGLLPSQVTYDFLNQVLDPGGVRQDHLALGRTIDEEGRVTGAGLYASKIGGPVDGAMMLIPDPMGATGSTVSRVLNHYAKEVSGRPKGVIAVHLIVTPEYLRHVCTHHKEVRVYALRLDRGLSPPEVLGTVLGTRWDEERGLTDHDYIVPGGGGLGEVLNNSFVNRKELFGMAEGNQGARLRPLISAEQIAERNRQLGEQIARDYAGGDLTVIGVLKGSFVFVADLARQVHLAQVRMGEGGASLTCEFLGLESYGDETSTSGVVKITADLTRPIEGRHVLVVEDIVDTGLTMNYLLENLRTRHPASIKVCALLHKPARTVQPVRLDYLGFTVEDLFVIGYGLDYQQRYRNLPYIAVLEQDRA